MPAVAGRFYPGTAAQVRAQLRQLLPADATPRPAIAAMAPHAGWIYSGGIAGETWSAVRIPSRVILLCPNHTGHGARRSIWSGGDWLLPTGAVPVDHALTAALAGACGLTPDRAAHEQEHAIEVHLPLLQACRPDVRIAAICLAGLDLQGCAAIGAGLAEVVGSTDEIDDRPLIVASSDMSHYISARQAATLDRLALDRVLALDPAGLLATVTQHRISMCGVLPMTATLFAARALGATRAELVRYGHSGERSGDDERVVGYAGVVVRGPDDGL
jgi:AmmeMemoRadiSam system protein B